jgi:hypothetical protein
MGDGYGDGDGDEAVSEWYDGWACGCLHACG